MENRVLPYKSSTISYYQFGTGPTPVLCFHGYGEDGTGYAFLEKTLGREFTFYALDLPLHGKTDWNEGLLFTPNDLKEITNLLLQKQGSTDILPVLLGFSLGSRVALQLYQLQPSTTAKLVLLAPDGLKLNRWYWLATQTWIGNRLFRFTMLYPGAFFGLLKILKRLRLVNTSIFKFVNYYIADKNIRDLLYKRWTTLRKIKPDLQKIKESIVQYKTPVKLVYGKYDRIILPARGEKFKRGIETYCHITVIEAGHQLLHEKYAEEIKQALLH